MSNESFKQKRCDLCGPYSPERAAYIVMGVWKPTPTGYVCPECKQTMKQLGESIARSIDAECEKHFEEL